MRCGSGRDAGVRMTTYQEGAGFGSLVHPSNDYLEVPEGEDFLCYGEGNRQYRDALAASGELDDYHLLHAARADLLRRVGSKLEAAQSYTRALALVTNQSERRFLERRLRELQPSLT